ncbi:hypothetical protein [Paenibacillus sinopodophylli]|uniref:hypothetical protein n=1 Tax=Paenibacillus sinopodophylli TaxID=1837342 RepID=UPI00110CE1CC|nr:hypothetical protein [Paenibacillus sinopodophylli]
MIVHADGGYETGAWLTAETYPSSYFIEDQSELADKVKVLYPYYTLDVVDGVLVDVTARAKTPEEIEFESMPPLKTVEQLRIDQLEEQLALQQTVIDALVLDALGGGGGV